MSKRKSSRSSSRPVVSRSRQSSNTSEHARSRARAALLTRIRGAVLDALKPHDLLGLLWDLGRGGDSPIIDVDVVVDEFARTHDADGYRDPDYQKAALDE